MIAKIPGLLQAIKDAPNLYHQLIFFVGLSQTGKSNNLKEVSKLTGFELLNLNQILSLNLLEFPTKQRGIQIPKVLNEIIDSYTSGLILDNTELLFEHSLNQNPLKLLQSLSRNRILIVSWNGQWNHGKLIYAEPTHPEYRSYDSQGHLVITTTGESNFELSQV